MSIIIPFYQTKTEWVKDVISSLNGQTDHDFELIAVFDGQQPELAASVREAVCGAYRFTSITLEVNKGVSAATNAGIDASAADYFLVLDHDDTVSPIFVETFRFASATTNSEILYADEAITGSDGITVEMINTRGQFDLRHYLSHPYIVHPIFIQRDVAVKAGRFDESMQVSHDVDFMLRCLAESSSVTSIPLCIYFWRTSSTSLGHTAAEHVMDATTVALRTFVSRKFGWLNQSVKPGPTFNTYTIYPPTNEAANVAIIIPTKNHSAVLRTCVNSILTRTRYNNVKAHIFVVDHDSTEPQLTELFEEYNKTKEITVIPYSGPWNYSAINNYAIAKIRAAAKFTHVLLMNNDIELITDDWLDRLVSKFSFGDVGSVGCCLIYGNNTVQHGGVIVGLHGAAEHSHKFFPFYRDDERHPGYLGSLTATRDYEAVTAALIAIRMDVLEKVDFLDEQLAVGFNDTDLCLRISELGLKSCYAGDVVAYHHESLTRGVSAVDPHPEDSKLFVERHQNRIDEGDRHYGALMNWDTPHIAFSYQPQKDVRLKTVELAPYYRK